MKNKKITYLLLTLVILIWGYVIVGVFGFNEKVHDDQFKTIQHEELIDTITNAKRTLRFDFKDPFLKRSHHTLPTKHTAQKRAKSAVRKQNKPTIIQWPIIEYGGSVNNSKGLMKINKRLYIVKGKDIINEMKIEHIFPDSIQVRFKNERKTIPINK